MSSGAFKILSYYLENGIQDDQDAVGNYYYPEPPLLIKSSFYINITSITFINNYFIETNVSGPSIYKGVQAQAIDLRYSKFTANFGNLTIRNHTGVDLNEVSEIIGEDETEYINTVTPDKRGSIIGEPIETVTEPNYYNDFGFKASVIKLYYASTESETDYKNSLTSITFDAINIYNLSYYGPGNLKSMFMDLKDDVEDVNISYLNIDLINCYIWECAAFAISNHENFYISSGIITSLNLDSYNSDSIEYTYCSQFGGLLKVNMINKLDNKVFEKFFNNLFITQGYSIGSSVLFVRNNDCLLTSTQINLNITNTALISMGSRNEGTIHLNEGSLIFVNINNSTFDSNYCKTTSVDIIVKFIERSTVSGTTFKLFQSSSIDYLQPIDFNIDMENSLLYATFDNTTLCCNEDNTSSISDYFEVVNSESATFGKMSPIVLRSGKLETNNCFFEKLKIS